MESYLALVCFLSRIVLPVVDGTLPDLATLCPYNDFCTTKATKSLQPNETHLMPCCQKCSCEADCQLFGNCCPDKELTSGVVRYPCVDLDQYYNKPRGIPTITTRTNVFYHVIDDCPTTVNSYEYPKCSAPRDLEDLIFVTDRLTGRVYKNKDCAKCHGVKEYVEWEIATNCPYKSEGLTREEWFSYVLKSCIITPILFDISVSQAFRCYPKSGQIKKCNVTGTWKRRDVDIKKACELDNPETNSLYYHERFDKIFRRDAYQNAFCKLCNPLDDKEWSDLCIDVLSTPNGGKLTSSGFSVVINFKKPTETSLSPKCVQGHVWDPHQKSCMPVTCPVSSFLQTGKCEDMYKRLPGESFEIMFRVKPHRYGISSELMKGMHDVITGLINNRYCYTCSSQRVYEWGKPDIIHLVHSVKTTTRCSEDYLIQQITMLARNPHSYYHSNLYPNITLVPDLSIQTPPLTQHGVPYIENACPNGIPMNLKLTDRCPRIPLTYVKLNTSTLSFETERNGSVCLNEYFDIMRPVSSSNHIEHTMLIINILATSAFIFFRL